MKLYRILTVLITLIYISIVASCGGSDSGSVSTAPTPPPIVSNADPEGVWEGTYTENGVGTFDIIGIVKDDKVIFISDAGGIVYVGTVSVSGTSFTAAPTSYASVVTSFDTTSLSGTVSTKSMISGILTSSAGEIGNFSLTYSALTDNGSSLATSDGNWMRTNPGYTAVISVDVSGLLSGSDTLSCVYSGLVSIIDPAINIYGLSLNASSCSVSIYNGTFTGYFFVSDTVMTNDTITYFFDNANIAVAHKLNRT